MITLGTSVIKNKKEWIIIGDGYNHNGDYGYLCRNNDKIAFHLKHKVKPITNRGQFISPSQSPLVISKHTGRTVINYGCSSNTHQICKFKLGQVIKDEYGNILTVMTRGDVVYYYCAVIDSNIYTVSDKCQVLGNVYDTCALTGVPLNNIHYTIHTKMGNIHTNNIPNYPPFVQSCLSNKWYSMSYSHIMLDERDQPAYIGYDEIPLINSSNNICLCKYTRIPFIWTDNQSHDIHPVFKSLMKEKEVQHVK